MLNLDQTFFGTAMFWSSIAVLFFAYALALQVRIIIPMTLRILLADKWRDGKKEEFDQAVQNAVRGISSNEIEEYLIHQQSKLLRWIVFARVVSKISVAGLILCFIIAVFSNLGNYIVV